MLSFPPDWRSLRVALCHDWLTGMRGGERVLEILCAAFPDAPILTLLHIRGSVSPAIESHPIHTSFLQRIPGIASRYRYFLPLFPAAVGLLRCPPADLVISTSHCVAKSVKPPRGAAHLCYCFTPMRYAWRFYDEYFGKNAIEGAAIRPMLAALRSWDRATAHRVTRFVAISEFIRERISEAYGRDSDMVYPPVDTDRCTPAAGAPRADYDLVVSALVPYKRIDLAVAAYTRSGRALRVVGVGSELHRLRAMAGPNVEFSGRLSDAEVVEQYRHCRFLVFPGEEDFGIVPLEAQACGRPVIAFNRGGARETVCDGLGGVFFDRQTPEELLAAVARAESTAWNPSRIREHALRFHPRRFVDGLAASIDACRSSVSVSA